ncbi:aromatic ring-hydroxylating oxygenase subunit alpha [Lentzea albida]|uniref:3-phenylpropionate/trans-cinnamate dioxygenase alpha subunit n=1 Tax=Lentzea albida TaxID=65499 RepID=A0A1H9PPX7_9PSEU|nr:aromatic ring-hydroxylating dioxygenase subunit alpha [Lentzea albida]SER49829.1 3-phenylpropionate/trans-cinnamate dioxygenase alpha subunit [Lentzea albida]
MTDVPSVVDRLDDLVRLDTGELDRRIFSDQEIFDLEMKNIFGRAWLFLCHDTQIPKRGDFFEAPMGSDNVLVVRQRDGSIRAFLNTCSHRGNAVCRAEEGNVRNFMCTYHGWTFGLDGELVGVPGKSIFYKDKLDLSKHPLRKVAQLDTYRGFVFATFDETAPPLEEYLGATGRLGLDLIAERGDMVAVPGVQKFTVQTNWKFTVDNVFDYYHPQITHMSAFSVGLIPAPPDDFVEGGAKSDTGANLEVPFLPTDLHNFVVVGEYGHAISGPDQESLEVSAGPEPFAWRHKPEVEERLGRHGGRVAGHPHIFPTTWVTTNAQLSLRVPRSPDVTEIWWFSFRDRNASQEEQAASLDSQIHFFGPAGMLEQEDGENWAQSTLQTKGLQSREVPQLLKMGLGTSEVVKEDGLAFMDAPINEHAQLWTYHAWREWLRNPSWEELRERTIPRDRY